MTISLAASSRLELKIGCFFNVPTSALSTSGVSVNRAPFFSYLGANFLRNTFNCVKSASSNCVTRGTVFQLSDIRRTITWRNGVSGFLLTGPHCEKSICSVAGLAGTPAAPGAGLAAALISR